jgi:hypothetical protein
MIVNSSIDFKSKRQAVRKCSSSPLTYPSKQYSRSGPGRAAEIVHRYKEFKWRLQAKPLIDAAPVGLSATLPQPKHGVRSG